LEERIVNRGRAGIAIGLIAVLLLAVLIYAYLGSGSVPDKNLVFHGSLPPTPSR
jgi:hypothetical protein